MRRFAALTVVGFLLLPGLLAALPGCAPQDDGCVMPMAGSHDCCPPPDAALVADCCVTSAPAVPRSAPTAPERSAPVAAPLLAPVAAPPPALAGGAPPSTAPPPPLDGGERHVVLRR
jgi:hypothetical protein